jgi:alanine-synthesizing transaminase
MAGWRIGFAVGNERLIAALSRVKSYLDYGAFTPIQVAATAALNGPQDCIAETRARYQARRDVMVDGLRQAGWEVPQPEATMFAWAPIPPQFRSIGSLAFSKLLLERANVENRQRLRQAARNIKAFLSGRNDTPDLRRDTQDLAAAS